MKGEQEEKQILGPRATTEPTGLSPRQELTFVKLYFTEAKATIFIINVIIFSDNFHYEFQSP